MTIPVTVLLFVVCLQTSNTPSGVVPKLSGSHKCNESLAEVVIICHNQWERKDSQVSFQTAILNPDLNTCNLWDFSAFS